VLNNIADVFLLSCISAKFFNCVEVCTAEIRSCVVFLCCAAVSATEHPTDEVFLSYAAVYTTETAYLDYLGTSQAVSAVLSTVAPHHARRIWFLLH
jgi:hypothetical protein